jgi:hypothetical protein
MNYNCKTCKFECKYLSNWVQHIQTARHKNDGKKTRKVTRNKNCSICDYTGLTYSDARNHYLSKHGTTEEKKKEYPYYCDSCNIGSFGKCIYEAHCKTNKHLQCSFK